MKRPLDCKDYERMTYEAVGAKYDDPEERNRMLYMAMTMHQWDAAARNGYEAGKKELAWHKHMLKQLYELESNIFSTTRPLTHMIANEPKTYRVSFTEKGGIEVVCFDLENIDSELEGYYDGVSDLPEWVQERIAVLSVCNPDPPTPVVEEVGRRISDGIFWIYK